MITSQVILLTISAYILGAIPTAYLAGRWLRGIDIRDYGSGASSGSNVWHSVSRWAIIPVGIFDVLKGLAPVAIADYGMGFDIWAQGVVAIAAIVGHSWSVFLNFKGGRGFATMIGAVLILAPWELLVFIVVTLSIFFLLKNSPIGMLTGAVSMPVASAILGEPLELTWVLTGVLGLLIVKRLMADRPIPQGDWRRVMLNRFLFDRDMRQREAWIYRKPEGEEEPPQPT